MAKIELMIDFKNKVYNGAADRKSLFDCTIPERPKGVIIFMHGYKGYKDWGAWNLLQQRFVVNGFGFVKFNVSHNGGTVSDPIDFPDLDAFGSNCYSFELIDLNAIITEVKRMINDELTLDVPIHLFGHSRGGGVCILKGSQDERIHSIISLAGISSIADRFPDEEELEEWKDSDVRYVLNGRTNQQMPHYFSFYLDFVNNQKDLNIQEACERMNKPFLQIHGDMDMAVSISEGLRIAEWTNTEVAIIKGGEHTFGTKQPWDSEKLPEEMEEVIQKVLSFLENRHSDH